MPEYTAQKYIDDVVSGQQVTCKWVRLAVKRHLRDLERVGKDKDFPYYFDEAQAKRVINFKQELRHIEGEWADPRRHDTRLRLEPWQQFIDWVLFGWRRPGGYRRFTKAYIEVARKNGKTTDAAATADYCFLADRPREIGAQVYCVATKKDQAKIAWDYAQRMLQANRALRDLTHLYKQSSTVVLLGTPARMKPLGQDSDTEDGLNPHFALVDEYHAHPDNSMVEVMASGMGARKQPLIYIITTAGFDKSRACYQEEHVLSERILGGVLRPAPETFFCIIYTLDEEDDWTDKRVWPKANPNLGVSVSWQFLEERMKEALHSPAKQNKIKTKHFNIWTQAENRWLTDEVWAACGKTPVDEEQLRGRQCVVGIDLSATQDITAVVYCFLPRAAGGAFEYAYRFFIPAETVVERERKEQVPYTQWIDQGLVKTTPGDAIDYDLVEREILRDAEKFRVLEITYDPWKAQEMVNHLQSAGFQMVAIRQGFQSMSGPTDTFEKLVLARRIAHGNHPVMAWMMSCTEVKNNAHDDKIPVKPDRRKSAKRIDGVVASIMATSRALSLAEIPAGDYRNEPTPRPQAAGMREMVF
jgi:phage terminase large subunit-like protein